MNGLALSKEVGVFLSGSLRRREPLQRAALVRGPVLNGHNRVVGGERDFQHASQISLSQGMKRKGQRILALVGDAINAQVSSI